MTIQAHGGLAETSINLPGTNHCNAPGHCALDLEGGCEVCSSRSAGVCVYTWLDCGELGGDQS